MSGLVELLISPVTSLLDKFIPDADTKAQLAHQIATMADSNHQALMLAQIEVNKAEAQHPSLFVSGWRPAFGWVCAAAFANNFILMPYAAMLFPDIQPLAWEVMSPVVMGLLGLGGARTVEKVKGVARA